MSNCSGDVFLTPRSLCSLVVTLCGPLTNHMFQILSCSLCIFLHPPISISLLFFLLRRTRQVAEKQKPPS